MPEFSAVTEAGGAPLALGVTVQGVDDGSGLPAGASPALLAASGFTGARGQSTLITEPDGAVTVLVGLGDAGEVDLAAARKAGSTLAKAARHLPQVATSLAADAATASSGATPEQLAQAVVEGIALKSYAFDRYLADPDSSELAEVLLVGADESSVERGARISDAVCFTRDLVNEPGGSLTPLALAEAASDMAQRENLQLTVLDEAAIGEAKLGGLLGVNRGSSQPPVFIQVAYEPRGAGPDTPTIALVGKGITFDAGGLSIKTAEGMLGMKADMGGAGAVLGAMSAVAAVGPAVRVAAYLPCTDNMLGPDATRPGDVLTIRGGTTVEITNTDAEGRLVLADALVLAAEGGPAAILDLATLTGACMVALGSRWAGLMGNHDGWLGQIEAAAARAGEAVWRLPLPAEYHDLIESPIADLRNSTSTRYGGALTAGLFLQDFVGEVPWAHLDIAGPAFSDDVLDLGPKGGTGFGVRTILELVQAFEAPSAT